MVQNQFTMFVFYLICGIIISITFDFFRALRKSIKTTDFTTNAEDILFLIITGTFLILVIYKYSYGELRLYIPIALLLGSIVYYYSISKTIIIINISILQFVIRIFKSIFKRLYLIVKNTVYSMITKIKNHVKIKKN